jgi:biotin carboxyl carrier protein
MTAQQSSNASSVPQHSSGSPFRVLPPHPITPSAPTKPKNTAVTPSPSSQSAPALNSNEKTPNSNHRLMIGGVIALGGLAISFIPTPYQVGGDVKLDWRETARQSVHTPIPAVVEQVLVQLGDQVQVGQPILQAIIEPRTES